MSSLRALDLGFTGINDQALAFLRVTDSQDDHAGPHGLMKLAVLNLKGARGLMVQAWPTLRIWPTSRRSTPQQPGQR